MEPPSVDRRERDYVTPRLRVLDPETMRRENRARALAVAMGAGLALGGLTAGFLYWGFTGLVVGLTLGLVGGVLVNVAAFAAFVRRRGSD